MKELIKKMRNELDTHDYIDGIRHESNKKFLLPVISIFFIVVITLIYLVSTYKSDGTFLERNEKKEIITNINDEKVKEKIETREKLLNQDEIKEIQKNYEKDKKTKTQEFFGLNIKGNDFFKQEFLTFLSQNEIKNLRMKLRDFLEYNKLTIKYINGRNMKINVFIENKKDISLIKDIESISEFVGFVEVPFKGFELEGLKEVNNELKKINQKKSSEIKMIIVGNEDEIKLLYEKNLSYLFDFWGVYENDSLEKSKERIKKINAQLLINNERSIKSVILVNFTSKDDLEFMKGIRRIQVVNHLYFHDFSQYEEILKRTIEERIKEINQKNENSEKENKNEENQDNSSKEQENKDKNEDSKLENEENSNKNGENNGDTFIQLPSGRIIDDETRKEIDRINSIEDIKKRNLEILKIIDKL